MEHEGLIRLTCFIAVFVVVAYAETVAPRRVLSVSKGQRWFNNLGIIALGSLMVKGLFPFAATGIAISMVIKMTVVAALGVPVIAVLLFEITLNATAMFNHGNLHLPQSVDRVLRWITVTPDMHRVHHSVLIRETNSNFGFNFPWWDRLCGTYRAQPAAGHTDMNIGIGPFREPQQVTLPRLLILPFGKDEGRYSLKHIGSDPPTTSDND